MLTFMGLVSCGNGGAAPPGPRGAGAQAGDGGAGAQGGDGGASAQAGDGGASAQGGDDGANAGNSSAGAAGAAPMCTTTSSLRDAASCSDRLFGTALSTLHLADTSYASDALEFNYVTPENEMKWEHTEATRNEFTFDEGDQIVDFAMQHDMKVKGHTLVWHNQLPDWVSAITDPDDLRAAMTNHITQEMQHYKGKVIAWDVVNEAWDPDYPTMLRDSVFSRVLGPSFIDTAFTTARAADPDAKLYYNDYSAEGLNTKSNSIYAMVMDMKSRGIPIDGVGLQMHWRSVGTALTAADVVSNMQRLGALGVDVVISEMDVELCNGGTLDDQKTKFHDMVAACLSQPNCPAVTVWGITDKYSWLNDVDEGCAADETPRPLLWDDGYQKKPAYDGVMNALVGP
ncbi:MAG TPA: endo-1,4-beta-xylanase [Polyangiaceae bacterium]|nr:endo-1,4-beta-xylanase [Polyangiaceae bacterium]